MAERRGCARGLRAWAAAMLVLWVTTTWTLAAPEEDPAAEPPTPTAADARRLLAEGRVQEALEAYRAALEHATVTEAPVEGRADLALELARALVSAGAPDEALGRFEEALALRSRDADLLDYAEALLAVARRNLEAPNPTSVSVLPYLADAIAFAGRAADPALAGRRERLLAEAHFWRGDDAVALEHWEKAGLDALAPEAARVPLGQKALALYRLGRFAEAADTWRQAGDRRGEASAAAALKDAPRAMGLYALLLAENPEDESLLADALSAARFTNARAALSKTLAGLFLSGLGMEGPVAARVLRVRGLLAEESGDPTGAAALFRQAAAADPRAVTPWVDLGRVLLAASGPEPTDEARDAALGAWLEALRRDPSDERVGRIVWDQAGIDFSEGTRAGGNERALARSLRAQRGLVASRPEDAEAWANLGNSLRVAGEVAASLEAYARAVELDPESASIVSDSGLAAAGAGDLAGALKAFERAVEIDPSFTSARQNAARFRWVAGEDDAAEAHLDAALEAARSEGKGEMLFRFLLDRTWRTRRRPEVR